MIRFFANFRRRFFQTGTGGDPVRMCPSPGTSGRDFFLDALGVVALFALLIAGLFIGWGLL